MLRIAVVGASGRTGREVVASVLAHPDVQLFGAFASSRTAGTDIGDLLGRQPLGLFVEALSPRLADADVVIDFSLPEALEEALEHMGNTPLVTGTTGGSAPLEDALSAHATRAAVIQAPNFSPGVQVLLHLAAIAATGLPEADIEVVEAHHRGKLDSPSGTARALVRAAAEARGWDPTKVAVDGRTGRAITERPTEQIGVHSVRAGGIVGDHDLSLSTAHETLTIRHQAHDRSGFALGAVRAARWIVEQPPGRYEFAQVLGLR